MTALKVWNVGEKVDHADLNNNFNLSNTLPAWFATLPTTLPATPGQPWNNGGTLAFS